ncbi:metal ABC transporter permease [Marinithermus hydrothermalis]|uniref:ABC-type transporter, integral membrane subunit n=1 Tax=Marinithermus hydrothermalis (strain DSM 14884 / JCM 11576 / T1) TaxID=869210 RepID=F2NMF8_MARHT|nr:metal ABC transporter permease [Marinithermus hydrothermalis]AEB12128.1 ABC-type transporter, integral membrane subunit [Marinithermus hydrothermalis DSM 14884]
MLEALSLPFMQRALIAGILVGGLASYYGVFVVQRGMSFLGSGLAHAAFGGVALGILLGTNPLWVAVPFTVVVALGIAWVRARTALGGDTAVGIFFSLAVALGVLFLSLRREYTADAFAYLFGSILAVVPADLWVVLGVVGGTLLALPAWGRFAYATFDRELALSDRLRVERDDYLLTVLIAVTVVVAVKVVGIVLVASFMVIPAATARLLSRTFYGMTLVSVLIGVISAPVGLWISYGWDVPSGAAIVLVQATLFFLALLLRR